MNQLRAGRHRGGLAVLGEGARPAHMFFQVGLGVHSASQHTGGWGIDGNAA